MDILNNEFLFSFLLDGAAAADCVISCETRRTAAGEARTYRFPGGLTVTTVLTLHSSHGTGVVLVFRREASPYGTACFPLYGLGPAKSYAFDCPDTGEYAVYGGSVLTARGLPVGIKEKGASRLYFYTPEA